MESRENKQTNKKVLVNLFTGQEWRHRPRGFVDTAGKGGHCHSVIQIRKSVLTYTNICQIISNFTIMRVIYFDMSPFPYIYVLGMCR